MRDEHRCVGRDAPLNGAVEIFAALADTDRKRAIDDVEGRTPISARSTDAGANNIAPPAAQASNPAAVTPGLPQRLRPGFRTFV